MLHCASRIHTHIRMHLGRWQLDKANETYGAMCIIYINKYIFNIKNYIYGTAIRKKRRRKMIIFYFVFVFIFMCRPRTGFACCVQNAIIVFIIIIIFVYRFRQEEGDEKRMYYIIIQKDKFSAIVHINVV